jgi:methyl-accepting chemotaxis protein
MSVLAKVILLTCVLVGFFIVSQVGIVFRLSHASALTEGQAQAVRSQNEALASQAKVLAKLKLVRSVTDTLHDLSYWLVDLSLSLKTESEREAQAAYAKLDPLLAELEATEPEIVRFVRPVLAAYLKEMTAAADAYTDGNRVLGNSLIAEGHKKAASMDERLTRLSARVEELAAASAENVRRDAGEVQASSTAVIRTNREINHLTYAVLVGAALIGAVSLFYLARSVFRPFDAIIHSLQCAAEETASASDQVSVSSQSLAAGASEQAAALEESSASLEEMSSMTKRNAENAAQAKELATQTCAAADAGAADMERMNAAMNAIKAAGDEVAKIVKSIDEIAFQTNILALNAAVEAARAGEAGMGFAVVAEEVRNLAQRSAQAAKDTAEKIQDSVQKSGHGVAISGKVAASLQEIVGKVRKMDELAAEIATACKEQNDGIGQVNTAVSEMDKVTQRNAASAEESASAATELNAQAGHLKVAVSQLLELVGARQGRRSTAARDRSAPHAEDAQRHPASSSDGFWSDPPIDRPARHVPHAPEHPTPDRLAKAPRRLATPSAV